MEPTSCGAPGLRTAQAQARLEDDLRPAQADAATTTTTAPPATSTPVSQPRPTAPPATVPSLRPEDLPGAGEAAGRIEAPAIGLDWVFVQGVSVADLKLGPGHYPQTPMPGQAGNAAIAPPTAAPFNRIDELEPGDEIIVTIVQGRFRYGDRQRIVDPSAVEVLDPVDGANLLALASWVLVEAARRFSDPPEVLGVPMLIVAVGGLAANLVAFALLRRGSKESLNVEGAYLEVLSDTVGSIGVIIGAVLVLTTGWTWVDPLIGVAIGVWIVPRTLRLAARAVRILVQAAPPGTDVEAIRSDLAGVGEVVDVHDLHLWTLTSDMEVASAHLVVRQGAHAHGVLDRARAILKDRYGIGHATLQVEPGDRRGCDEIAW